MTDKTYGELCREQRAAYFAWQAAADPYHGAEFAEYLRASAALEAAQKRNEIVMLQ